jgi:hypothetical protein
MMVTAQDLGCVELGGERPAGVEIDEVVVAELLALQLVGVGDAEWCAVGVERGGLVGVFAVAERVLERGDDAEG